MTNVIYEYVIYDIFIRICDNLAMQYDERDDKPIPNDKNVVFFTSSISASHFLISTNCSVFGNDEKTSWDK